MERKKKKEKRKLTKKQLLVITIITIVLGIICYFLATEITKKIIDHKTIEQRLAEDEFTDLQELDKISSIDLVTLINSYNEFSDNDIDFNSIIDNKITVNNINFEFYLDNDNVYITAINYKNKTSATKKVIYNMIKANNNEIDDATIDMIYDKVFETLGNTSDDKSETSEFFQYQGLEFSLKEYKDNDYKYSFRIGRIMDEGTKTAENE